MSTPAPAYFLTKDDVPSTPKQELVNSRFPIGTLERMDKVLRGGELRSAFIRVAVEAELQRREAAE